MLEFPSSVADLVLLALNRMNLSGADFQEDMISCPLEYENGTEISLIIICQAEAGGWFRNEKPVVSFSFVELNDEQKIIRVLDTDKLDFPTSPQDLMFLTKFIARVRAIGWTIAAVGQMGECLNLPNRPVVG